MFFLNHQIIDHVFYALKFSRSKHVYIYIYIGKNGCFHSLYFSNEMNINGQNEYSIRLSARCANLFGFMWVSGEPCQMFWWRRKVSHLKNLLWKSDSLFQSVHSRRKDLSMLMISWQERECVLWPVNHSLTNGLWMANMPLNHVSLNNCFTWL